MSINYEDLNKFREGDVPDSFTKKRYTQMVKVVTFERARILDIGSGLGFGGEVIRNKFPEAYIVAIDAIRENTLRDDSIYNELIHSSSKILPFENETFDVVLAAEILEHIESRDVDYFLQELFRILKIHGLLILTTPNPNDLKLRLRRRTILGHSHISQHFPKSTKIRFNLAGFRVLRVRGTGKTSSLIGTRLPLNFYGSFLVVAEKG